MPELPEVETSVRDLRRHVLGKRVRDVSHVDWPRMLPNATEAELREALVGRQLAAVSRRGKYVLADFEDETILAFHRKMSGNLLWRPAGAPAAATQIPTPHTHLVIHFEDGGELAFVDPRKFGRVYRFGSGHALGEFLNQRLGPEPLEIDLTAFADRLRGRPTRIKTLLLDQRFLAGIGNLYADEALWEAGIHPFRPASNLRPVEVRRLHAAIQAVLERAIARRGTSFDRAYVGMDGLPGENQSHLNVYGRAGTRGKAASECPRCAALIQRVTLGQRSSHFCARCQRAPRPPRRPSTRNGSEKAADAQAPLRGPRS